MEAATGFAKQMIEFQKSLFKNTFDSMAVVQAQAGSATNTFLKQIPGDILPQVFRFGMGIHICSRQRDDIHASYLCLENQLAAIVGRAPVWVCRIGFAGDDVLVDVVIVQDQSSILWHDLGDLVCMLDKGAAFLKSSHV